LLADIIGPKLGNFTGELNAIAHIMAKSTNPGAFSKSGDTAKAGNPKAAAFQKAVSGDKGSKGNK
jgi:hypothetical protein